jgi:hypothetical protein
MYIYQKFCLWNTIVALLPIPALQWTNIFFLFSKALFINFVAFHMFCEDHYTQHTYLQDNARRCDSLEARLTLIQLFSVISLWAMYLEAIAFQLRAKNAAFSLTNMLYNNWTDRFFNSIHQSVALQIARSQSSASLRSSNPNCSILSVLYP